jgi:hypothetical protein
LALGPFGGLPEELLAAPHGLHQGQIREFQERGPQEAHQFGRLTRRLDLPGLGWAPLLDSHRRATIKAGGVAMYMHM